MTIYDVLILGAGPAGLSAAGAIARQRRTALVLSHNIFRNRLSKHMHNVPTWDHQDPAEFRAETRKQLLARYPTISFADEEEVTNVAQQDNLFVAKTATKEFVGRKLIIATGSKDTMLDVPGYEEAWTKRIFHCMFCHGYEEYTDLPLGYVVKGLAKLGPFGVFPTIHLTNLTSSKEKITVMTNGEPTIEPQGPVAGVIKFDDRKIARFAPTANDITVHFEDGTSKTFGFLAAHVPTVTTGPWEGLGLEKTPMGDIKVNETFMTNVPGVYAAGDCMTMRKAVSPAVDSGGTAGVMAITTATMETFPVLV